jgi:hypothetical protein
VIESVSNYLSTSKEVREIADNILTPSEKEEAYSICQSIVPHRPHNMRREALNVLYNKLEPSKPLHSETLHNAQEAIMRLPTDRRTSIGYLVDYIDELVKAMAFDFTKDPVCRESSFSLNVERLNSIIHQNISQELIDNLKAFESVFYIPAKNDFILEDGSEHLFSVSETVYLALVALKLADEITKASKIAKLYSTGRVTIDDLK